MTTFLNNDEVATLTGRKSKGRQIDSLRKMGIPFWVNAIGHPVIARSAIESKPSAAPQKPAWVPKVLQRG